MARILVIDDEALIALAVADALEDAGHDPVLGRAGRQLAHDLDRLDYDVVVTDLRMPGMDGCAVADWIARHRPRVPVIAFSGFLPPGRGLLPQFTAMVGKDAGIRTLARTVDSVARARGH